MNLPTTTDHAVAARLLDALRSHPRYTGMLADMAAERAREHCTQRLFSGRNPVMTVAPVAVRIDADMVGVVWRLVPNKGLDNRQKGQITKRVRAWQESPEAWTVEGDVTKTFLLGERMSLYALRRMIVDLLGDEGAEGMPVVVAAPIAPKAPMTPRAVAFTLRNVMPSVGGERFPFDGLADLVASLPGEWSLTPGHVVEGLTAATEYTMARELEHVLRRRAQGVSVRAYASPRSWGPKEPVECSFRLDANDTDRLVERDQLFRALVPAIPEGWEAGTLVNLPADAPRVYAEPRGWHVDEKHGAQCYLMQRVFVVRDAVVVTAPSGERFGIIVRSWHARSGAAVQDAMNSHAFYAWARRVGMTLLAERVLASYGVEGIDAYLEVLKHKPGDIVRLAECQICARIHMTRAPKGRDALMVDHGYKYPGADGVRGGQLGERVGSCYAVGYRSYERAHDALDEVIPMVSRDLAQRGQSIVRFQAQIDGTAARGRLLVGAAELAVKRGQEPSRAKDAPPWADVEPTDPLWPYFAERQMARMKTERDRVADHLAWLEKRRAEWTLRPTIGEHMAALKSAQAPLPDVPADA